MSPNESFYSPAVTTSQVFNVGQHTFHQLALRIQGRMCAGWVEEFISSGIMYFFLLNTWYLMMKVWFALLITLTSAPILFTSNSATRQFQLFINYLLLERIFLCLVVELMSWFRCWMYQRNLHRRQLTSFSTQRTSRLWSTSHPPHHLLRLTRMSWYVASISIKVSALYTSW